MPKTGEHMYRDGVIDLDEHDRAVGLILIGESLLEQCETATGKLSGSPDRWHALRHLHDDYEQVWIQLDRAKKVLAARGSNTHAYDELRTAAAPTLVATKFSKRGMDSHEVNRAAIDDARRAIAELKLVIPGADWSAIATRTEKLVAHEQRSIRRPWFVYALASVAVFGLMFIAWSRVVTPGRKVDQRAEMRAEIRSIASQRDTRLELMAPVATHLQMCDVKSAAEYTRLLRMDGQKDAARAFGTTWTGRCGVHDEVMKWTTGQSIFVKDRAARFTARR